MSVYQTLRKITSIGCSAFSDNHCSVEKDRMWYFLWWAFHSWATPVQRSLCCRWTDEIWQAGVWIWQPCVSWLRQELTDLTCGTIAPRCSPKGKDNFLSMTCPFKMSPMVQALRLISSVRGSNASWVPFCQKKWAVPEGAADFLVKSSGLCLEVVQGKSNKEIFRNWGDKEEHNKDEWYWFWTEEKPNRQSHVTDSHGPCCQSLQKNTTRIWCPWCLFSDVQSPIACQFSNTIVSLGNTYLSDSILTFICLRDFITLWTALAKLFSACHSAEFSAFFLSFKL